MWIQLHYFLHLGDEPKPQWNLLTFGFMIGVVLILVFGTLWIMNNLNDRMMPQMDSKKEMLKM
jgi:cytochrome o ubiquinol oxidase operon protein cyoD